MSRNIIWVCFIIYICSPILSLTLRAEEFPKTVEESYARYKAELFGKFIDQYGFVVNREGGKPADIGDAAWRTGYAAIVMAIEEDNVHTAQLLKALIENGWYNGRPIRHPDLKEYDFTRDQFVTQMAACYFVWKFGNDEVKGLAKTLLNKFIVFARANHWLLNPQFLPQTLKNWNNGRHKLANPAFVTPGLKYVLKVVSEKMDLEHNWSVDENIFYLEVGLQDLGVCGKSTDDPDEYYGTFLTFLQILLTEDTGHKTNQLTTLTDKLYNDCRRHFMEPLSWITGHFQEPGEKLKSWPPDWNFVDDVWTTSLAGQLRDAKRQGSESYPRLDYMLLRRLFDLHLSQ